MTSLVKFDFSSIEKRQLIVAKWCNLWVINCRPPTLNFVPIFRKLPRNQCRVYLLSYLWMIINGMGFGNVQSVPNWTISIWDVLYLRTVKMFSKIATIAVVNLGCIGLELSFKMYRKMQKKMGIYYLPSLPSSNFISKSNLKEIFLLN